MFQMKLFGFFRMTRKGQVLDEGSIHSTILIKLLVYMVLHRDRVLTNIELEKQLWKPQEIENPADALKNLMYRLRKALNASFGEGDYILTGRGNYRWNPAYEVQLDTEVFDALYVKVKESTAEDAERLGSLEAIAEIYGGMFLANIDNDYWVSNMAMMQHTRYLYAMEQLLVYHWDREDYEAVENWSTRALEHDPYEETMNLYKVKAYLRQDKLRQAEQFYRTLEQSVKSAMGASGSSLLRNLQRELKLEEKSHQISRQDLQRIVADKVKLMDQKAIICDFEEFRFLYALQAKRNKRRQEEGYTILITVALHDDPEIRMDEVEDYLMKFAMDGVKKVLVHYLREFDVVSQCSNSQYIVMLDRCSYNNSIKVAQRILKQYEGTGGNNFVKLYIDIQKIVTDTD